MEKYCKIYVSGFETEIPLTQNLAKKLRSNSPRFTIETTICEIYVDKSEDFDPEKQKQFPNGFLYFQYTIEIDFKSDVSIPICNAFIDEILLWLWAMDKPAVVSWDYEHDLIHQGGFKSIEVPFPK